MSAPVRYCGLPDKGIDAMSAVTARSFPRHTHDQYGIGLIDSGAHASHSGRGRVEAEAGDFICVNPGEVHDGRPMGDRPRAWRMLYFDPSMLQAMLEEASERAEPDFTFEAPVFADADLRRWFEAAFSAVTTQQSDTGVTEAALLRFVARVHVHGTSVPTRRSKATGCIRRVRARIDANPTAPHTLLELAKEARLSRYQLLRAFARDVGLTPHAYILQQRLALARRLVRDRVPLAEAALASGFCDQSHLTRCFSRQFGTSPGRYGARGL